MPKWQADDLYSDNFRINKGDSVTMFYKDNVALDRATKPDEDAMGDLTQNFLPGGEI